MEPLEKPGLLQTVIDPAFGTTIRRITDIEADVSGEKAVIKPVYSTIQAWNADESHLFLYSRADGHQLYDGITYQFIRNLDLLPPDLEELFWDFADPDSLYFVAEGRTLVRYSVTADTQTPIRSFETLCGDNRAVGGNDVQMMSWDSDLIGLRCAAEPAQLFGYRLSTDTITPVVTSGEGNSYSPWIAPAAAPSGTRFLIGEGTVLNAQMGVERRLNLQQGEHSSLGTLPDGSDALFAVAFAAGPAGGCGPGTAIAHNLATGHCRTLVGPENGYPYPPSGTHLSALAHQNPGWIAVSVIGRANGGDLAQMGQALLDNELLLIDSGLDGQVCRVAHHRSSGRGGSFGYWAEPHVVISPSGTRLLFASDWGGGDSVDSYVIELNEYSGTTIGPIPPAAPDQRLYLPFSTN